MSGERLMIACDHGGYELKTELLRCLAEADIACIDCGCHSKEIVRYPYYAAEVCTAVSKGEAERGILICTTGIGMSILANRYPGVRASLCTSVHMAEMTRRHNDSNILCLGGGITDFACAREIVMTWLETGFDGGRHCISLDLIAEIEATMSSHTYWPVPPIEDRR